MNGRKFVDTNVLVYRFDHDEPAKRDRTRERCTQVLTEDLQDGWKILGLEVLNPFGDLQAQSL